MVCSRLVREPEQTHPNLPVGRPDGALTRWSSYRHLAVNALALSHPDLRCEQWARDLLASWRRHRGI
jgi:hypothetical protein